MASMQYVTSGTEYSSKSSSEVTGGASTAGSIAPEQRHTGTGVEGGG